jgi:hypothetical protein
LVDDLISVEKRAEIRMALDNAFGGDTYVFIDGIKYKDEESVDDGNAHVTRSGARFCVGFYDKKGYQSDSKAEKNIKKMAKIIDSILCK